MTKYFRMYHGSDFFDDFFEPLTPPPPNTRDLRFWETPHLLFSFGYGLGVAKGRLVGPRGPEIILGSVYNSLPPLLLQRSDVIIRE